MGVHRAAPVLLLLSAAGLSRYTGTYLFRDMRMSIRADSGRLVLEAPDGDTEVLLNQGNDLFVVRGATEQHTVFEVANRRATKFTLIISGTVVGSANRVP